MDLSNAFDTINQSLLLAKLDSHGFSRTSLKLMQNYLCIRQQRISINDPFTYWTEVITDVPRGSILGPFLFNLFLNDILVFTSKCNLCIYANNNTLYSTRHNFSLVTHYSLKFSRCSLLVIKSLVTRCKIRSLQKFTSYLLQKLLVVKNHLLLLVKLARYSLQKLLVAKSHSLFVAKFDCHLLHKVTM